MELSAEIEKLIIMLQSPIRARRYQAIERLGQIGAPVLPVLLDALARDDRNQDMRSLESKELRLAIKALGNISLQALTGDFLGSPKTSAVAAKVLGEYYQDQAPVVVPALIAALQNSQLGLRARCYVAQALGSFQGDERASQALLNALKDKDKLVRENAAEALGQKPGS